MHGDEAKEDIREAVTRWLTDDPAAYWTLELAVRALYDMRDKAEALASTCGPLTLFTADEQRQFLESGLAEAEKAWTWRLIRWIKDHLHEIRADDRGPDSGPLTENAFEGPRPHGTTVGGPA